MQRESRMSAIQAIRSISNWLYWQPLNINGSSSSSKKSITRVLHKLPDPNIAKLKDAAAKRKIRDSKRSKHQTPLNFLHPEDYWAPSNYVLPSSTTATTSTIKKPSVAKGKKGRNESDYKTNENQNSPIRLGLPLVTALFGMASVRLHEVGSTHELKQHVGGSFALEIVNSSWLQYILAAATWYMLGIAVVELVLIIGSKNR